VATWSREHSYQTLRHGHCCWENRRTFHTTSVTPICVLISTQDSFQLHSSGSRLRRIFTEAQRADTCQGAWAPPSTLPGVELCVSFVLCDPDILARVVGSKVDPWPKLLQLASPSWEFRTATERQGLSLLYRGCWWDMGEDGGECKMHTEAADGCTSGPDGLHAWYQELAGLCCIPVLGGHGVCVYMCIHVCDELYI
jgi:hypothetical protein